MVNPDSHDWNRFWSGNRQGRFTRVSWSKRRLMKLLQPYCQPGLSALDAGCGSGFFAQFFCDRGMDTTALDYAAAALAVTREKTGGRAAVVQADMIHDDLPRVLGRKFDLIFTDGLFEHFTEPEQDRIMTQFVHVLNPGGRIVTVVPNRWSPWELIRPLYMPGIDEQPFVLKQLLTLQKRNGLQVTASGGLNTIPWRWSPDRLCGNRWGMLLYAVAQRAD